MATKAERFKAAVQRSKPGRAKQAKASRRVYDVDTARPGVSVDQRRAGGLSTGRRNVSLGRKATVAFEDSLAPNRPPRKSARKSKNRQKAGTQLKAKHTMRLASPEAPSVRGR